MENNSGREMHNSSINRRRDSEFGESVALGLRSAADLMRHLGRPSSDRLEQAQSAGGPGTWNLERLASSIASRVARLVGLERVDPDADFFDMGGSSVDAVELASLLARELGVDITLDDLFADARPRRLAERWLKLTGGADPSLAATPVQPGTSEVDNSSAELNQASTEDVADELQAIQEDLSRADALPWVDAPACEVPQCILLTGATGFLGSHLLFDLVRHSDAHVVCLVRAKDDAHAEERLAKALASFDLPWSAELKRRIIIVAGDLQEPRLGWEPGRWESLAAEVDSVVNVAAIVDFLRGYRSLRATNVHGPLTLAEFAMTARVKPLHHISSIAVFNEIGIRSMGEDDRVARVDRLGAGYDKSKWAVEAALRRAREHGLVVTFHRPGGIGGHTQTGAHNPKDLNTGFMAAWMAAREMPEFRYLNVAPVDWISRIIAAIVLEPSAWGYNYHQVGKPMSLREVHREMTLGGMNMKVLSFDEWRRRFLTRLEAKASPHLEFVGRVLKSSAALKLVEATLTGPAATADRTEAFIRQHKLPRPVPYNSQAQIATLERLIRKGLTTVPGRDDTPYLQFKETMEGAVGRIGVQADSPCRFNLRLSIASFYQLLRERRLDVHGEVRCALLHPDPLLVESGDLWARPDDGVPEQHGLTHPLLRYHLTLRAADGQRWWLEGTKLAKPGWNLWRQARTLRVEVGKLGEAATLLGEMVVPSDSYVREQIDGIEVNPSVAPREQRIAKMLWLAWFGSQLGLGFLDPALRVLAELLDGLNGWKRSESRQ